VQIIESVEQSLKYFRSGASLKNLDAESERSTSMGRSPAISEVSDKPVFEFFDGDGEGLVKDLDELPGSDQPGFGSSGYAIPGSDNGRILALVHAKGNMLYALGDNVGAAKAFESAVLIAAGRQMPGIEGLIRHILSVIGQGGEMTADGRRMPPSPDPILLGPEPALKTSQLCFPPHGQLPGLKYVSGEGLARKAAISTTSNSLLSLAKIFQDGMATNSPKSSAYQTSYSVREILALYYLSLSLQPSPSTANNVGILLSSVQQSAPSKHIPVSAPIPRPYIPGLVAGSGVALALMYYNYGLLLDSKHAHLYTNLGSLLKDIGQLDVAIQMYEQAVACDGNFDIALANLANAVKDKGRISDAITYYRRAVESSPDFAEAVCGLANALNSVCGWAGRGGIASDGGFRDRWHVDKGGMLLDARLPGASSSGWIKRVVDLVEKQLGDSENWGLGVIDQRFVESMVRPLGLMDYGDSNIKKKEQSLRSNLASWRGKKWEGARSVRLVERAIRRIAWQWYQDMYVKGVQRPSATYRRPQLPAALTVPAAPTVLPFHTFTCPMSAKQIRLISQRNGLRISCSTLKAPWLPPTVFAPPPPPKPYLKVGYVSSDFNNHPLAHLMQSVFGLHDPSRAKAYCYATTASDGSVHRHQIEKESPVFYDASNWSAEHLVNQIVQDGIHILINLNGYTRGARNEVFAARPAPIQMSFMGFAGTLGAEWCDYLLADDTAVPPSTLRKWRCNVDIEDNFVDDNSGGPDDEWVYGENIIFCRDTFFCCDHRQSAPDSQGNQLDWEEEQVRRWKMRKELFPDLPNDTIIFGNFNQLYKVLLRPPPPLQIPFSNTYPAQIEPTTFRTWLRILARVPNAVLWLLRFPDLGESNLKATAKLWAGEEVASRVLFTDVAQKHMHIARARVCDLFLDTPECNAHTTAADVLWSGTPLLTLPRYRYKMCSRMAASILKGALPRTVEGVAAARDLIAGSEEDYEETAVRLGMECVYEGHRATGRLAALRKLLYESRWSSALFDTRRWVRDLEEAYERAWGMWVRGEGGDIWLEGEKREFKREGQRVL
jgi:predicted O-linked N-acetylglucosamine transferase (SPINDLY family)